MNQTLVLMVDDNDEDICVIREVLRQSTTEIHQANSIRDANEKLQNNYYHMLVLDINLGGRECGIKFLKDLRSRNIWIPVCLYTGYTYEKVLNLTGGYNCLTCITKNMSLQQLKIKFNDMLKLVSEEGAEELNDLHRLALEVQEVFEKSSM